MGNINMQGIYYSTIDKKVIEMFSISYNKDIENKFDIKILTEPNDPNGFKDVKEVLQFIRDNGKLRNPIEKLDVNFNKGTNLDIFIETFAKFYSNHYSGIRLVVPKEKKETAKCKLLSDRGLKVNKRLSLNEPSEFILEWTEFCNKLPTSFCRNEDGRIKALPTKKTLVKNKKGAYVRNQHVKNKDTKTSRGQTQTGEDAYSFKSGDITRTDTVISDSITSGITKVKVGENDFFAKPVSGEKWTYVAKKDMKRKMVRSSIKLNSRVTDSAIEGTRAHKNLEGEEKSDVLKGTMADREVMASKLADELNMDHIPRAEKKMIDGKEQVISMDVHDAYKGSYDKLQDRTEIRKEGKGSILDKCKKDPKLADKIAFDFLIGNTDRHGGNIFVGTKKNGDVDMIGIDQGLSFPDDNRMYMLADYTNQFEFANAVKDAKGHTSDSFHDKLSDLKKSSAFNDYTKDLHNNVGKKEKDAFIDRVNSTIKAGQDGRKNR